MHSAFICLHLAMLAVIIFLFLHVPATDTLNPKLLHKLVQCIMETKIWKFILKVLRPLWESEILFFIQHYKYKTYWKSST